jgi:hypothetical protein
MELTGEFTGFVLMTDNEVIDDLLLCGRSRPLPV